MKKKYPWTESGICVFLCVWEKGRKMFNSFKITVIIFNPIQYGPFVGLLTDGGGGKKVHFPKIWHAYSTIMKLDTFVLT